MSADTSLRRIIMLVMLAAAGGAVISWLRGPKATPVPANPPEWPPLAMSDPASSQAPDATERAPSTLT